MQSFGEIIDKVVMLTLTFKHDNGEISGYKQVHGTICRANDEEGIVLYIEKDDKEISLPPDVTALQPARKGSYTESYSADKMVDPDFLCFYEIIQHAQPDNAQEWKKGPNIKWPT